jgi:hypothetical protein
MPTRLVHLAVDAASPPDLARFWAAALDWEVTDEGDGEVDVDPPGHDYPDPAALPLVFVPVPEPKQGKNRVHLDLATTSLEHQAALVARLRDLGARPADIGQGDVPWAVMTDPEGNEFCVLEPREFYRGTGPVAAVVCDCADPLALAGFWELASGCRPAPPDGSALGDDWVPLRSPGGTGPYLELLRVPGPKAVKNRIHLDVAPYRDDDRPAEVQRLRQAGAVPADVGQGDVPWVVLADPEGGEFCVLSPR